MKEKKSIDNFKEFVEEELFRDAERITAEVEAHMAQHPCEFPKDLDRKVMERIRMIDEKQKAYDALSEEDKEALRIGKEAMLLRELKNDEEAYEEEETPVEKKVVPYRKRSKKAFLLVALVAILVFVFGMTGIGGPPFILEMMNIELGEKEVNRVESEGDKENIADLDEEDKFEQEVRETFDTDFVEMEYLPKNTIFLTGNIDKEQGQVCILYQSEEKIIEYRVVLDYRQKSFGYDIEDELIKEEIMEISGIPIHIKTYKVPEGENLILANMEYKNAFYAISANISEEEFKNILKNLHFF